MLFLLQNIHFCICNPSGPYFKGGLSCIDLIITDEYHRAALVAQVGKGYWKLCTRDDAIKECKKKGFAEVIYLDAETHTYIEEVGAANFFCIKDDILYTPELTGTILPGITRDSVIQLAVALEGKVIEEKYLQNLLWMPMKHFVAELLLLFPNRSIMHDGKKTYSTRDIGPITQKLYDSISGIHSEKVEDSFGWLHEVNLNLNLENKISIFLFCSFAAKALRAAS